MYTHRGKKKCLQKLGWEIFRKQLFEDIGADRKILKCTAGRELG
jgi:hypothetical protein